MKEIEKQKERKLQKEQDKLMAQMHEKAKNYTNTELERQKEIRKKEEEKLKKQEEVYKRKEEQKKSEMDALEQKITQIEYKCILLMK